MEKCKDCCYYCYSCKLIDVKVNENGQCNYFREDLYKVDLYKKINMFPHSCNKDCLFYHENRCGLVDKSMHNFEDNVNCNRYIYYPPWESSSGKKNKIGYRESVDDEKSDSIDSDCFLTSACVNFYGKNDCIELTTMRRFRDEYLLNTDKGKILVDEYYKIAPSIVAKIDCSNKKSEYYYYIYQCIQDCMKLYKQHEYAKLIKTYTKMVITLKNDLSS